MSWGMVAVAGATLVGGLVNANQQKKAAQAAANAQTGAAQAGLTQQEKQFEALMGTLKPYREAGYGAIAGQQDLLGLSGAPAQQKAIDAIRSGPQFQAMKQQGEASILANASATGGLRGGNVQGALAQFSPGLLGQLINQQFSQLGSLTGVGANAAAMQGQAGQNFANQYTAGQGQIGAAAAGQALASGQANAGAVNSGLGALGMLGSSGALGKLFGGGGGAGGAPLTSTPQASMMPGSGGSLFGKLGF